MMRPGSEPAGGAEAALGAARPSADAAIGMFDSGVGGLTVARALARSLPREHVLYVADQAHVPYGGRPLEEVRLLATQLSTYLFTAGAKIVVMACNISSATALEAVRARFGRSRVYGVIDPGARAALAASARGRIGVLATRGTVDSGAYTHALRRSSPEVRVTEVACPRFVPLVEAGRTASPEAVEAAREYLAPILAAGCDTVILGCTHYPFLLDTLRAVAGPELRFVDPAQATVELVAAALGVEGLSAPGPRAARHRLLTTGDAASFRAQAALAWSEPDTDVDALAWGEVAGARA